MQSSIQRGDVLFVSGNKQFVSCDEDYLLRVRFTDSKEESLNFGLLFSIAQTHTRTFFHKQIGPYEYTVSNARHFLVRTTLLQIADAHFGEKFGVRPGLRMDRAILEWKFHSENLEHPIITKDHILVFGLLSEDEITEVEHLSKSLFDFLKGAFITKGYMLGAVSFRFGKDDWGRVVLVDITGFDLWDSEGINQIEKNEKVLYKILSEIKC